MQKRYLTALVVPLVMIATMGSSCQGSPSNNAQNTGQRQTEQAFRQQQAAVPYPLAALTDSTERRNLRERLLRFNRPDRLGYVYIMSMTGVPIGYYTIEGKISSTDSQMTTSTLIQHDGYPNGGAAVPVTAPGDDGSYGANEQGVFFFTTEGALVETSLHYLYSDQPIPTFASLPKLNGKGQVADLTKRK